MRGMASSLKLLLAVFSLPLIWQESTALAFPISSQTEFQKNHNSLIFEIQEANLKLAQLESVLEKTLQDLHAKSVHIRQSEKKIQEMNQEIDCLQTALANFEDNTSSANEDSHVLEEQMADIVSEQWIQIQQLDQALQMAELRASKAKRQLGAMKCPFMKSIKIYFGEHLEMLKGILDPYVSEGGHVLKSCISEASDHLKRTYTAAKHYHHQLQGYIKQTMLRNKFTAVLANNEVVFFLASALIIFPVLSLYTLLS